jgi:hypothetical protein
LIDSSLRVALVLTPNYGLAWTIRPASIIDRSTTPHSTCALIMAL